MNEEGVVDKFRKVLERKIDKCERVVDKYIWKGARGKSILNFQIWKVMTSFPKFKLS